MESELIALGKGLQIAGDLIIAIIVLSVHTHIRKERKIDAAVLRYMKKEQWFVYLGMLLLLGGYLVEMYAL